MRKQKSKRIKRKPDLRKIRTSHVYTLPEIAKCLDRELSTIQRWVKTSLPIIEGSKPLLVDGVELKAWLVQKWQSKKKPCSDGELYCCGCSKPQKPLKALFLCTQEQTKPSQFVAHVGNVVNLKSKLDHSLNLTKLESSFVYQRKQFNTY